MYSYSEWIEDNAAWFSRADRFEGFDRGDILDVDNEIGDAIPAEQPGDQTMHHTYEQAYAYHYPKFQEAYRTASLQACIGSRKDIYETLVHHYGRTPYEGKLMAELDAARERIANLEGM